MFRLIRSFFSIFTKRKYRLKPYLVFLVFLFSFGAESQQTINLPGYTRGRFHFGFIIAVNWADFAIDPAPDLAKFGDSLRTIRSIPQIGFDLGIVSELKLSQYLRFRFVPSLGFSDRQVSYHFEAPKDTFDASKDIQSVFLNFPLDLKLISKRLNNFEAYVLAGMKYSTDLASQKDVNQQLAGAKATIRLKRNDWSVEAGGGIEFYLPYFKFGLEIKISQGLRNLVIPDNSIYTQSINSLKSKIWLFSLTFEG